MRGWPRFGPAARANRERNLARIREGHAAGIRQDELARRLGLHPTYVSVLARGMGLHWRRGGDRNRKAVPLVVAPKPVPAIGHARMVRVCPQHMRPVDSSPAAHHEEIVMCPAGHRVWRWAVYDQERGEFIAAGSAKHSVVAFDVEWADWPDQAA